MQNQVLVPDMVLGRGVRLPIFAFAEPDLVMMVGETSKKTKPRISRNISVK